MTIVARFYPNGEFTHGVDTSRKRRDKRRHTPLQTSPSQECRGRYLQWVAMQISANADIDLCIPGMEFVGKTGAIFTYLCKDEQGYHYACEGKDYVLEDVLVNVPPGRSVGDGDLTPLGLSNARILNKPQESRKKCLKMTSSMARNIRNAAYIMETDYGKDCLSFLTLTIPSVNAESLMRICENWDKATHCFFVWLRRKLEEKNIDPSWVYCTEIQTKRLQKRHEYAPHLHILFRGRCGKKFAWSITPKQARNAWICCLKPYIDCPFDDRAVENLQRIRKSAGGYLSKYMSKGCNSLPNGDAENTYITKLRTHWGGMSRNLSRSVKSRSTVLKGLGATGHLAIAFIRAIPKLLARRLITFYLPGFIPLSDCPGDGGGYGIKVGYGRLSKPLDRGGLSDSLGVACRMYAD